MSQIDPLSIAHEFLHRLGSGAEPAAVAELFAEDIVWEIPGDTRAFPWIGQQSGRQAVLTFLRETSARIERVRLDVDDVLANEKRAVILGSLASRVRSTGKLIETSFAIVLTIQEGQIAHFQMLEDSFAVSCAATLGKSENR
ncbi:nuclear transport factor 2 family protein [Oceanicella sp. SM1341]|uniref:nuclear transport factor 2 family protein n=1 Tax=Oceanicella sp. SM1341 TaxID=1548889 RepID=UPI000E49057A|nr:nuclear transport factor 2 family protein [Oceanicella sp. SM1341]